MKMRFQSVLVEVSEIAEHIAVNRREGGSPYKANGVLMFCSWENLRVADKQGRFLTKMLKVWPGFS